MESAGTTDGLVPVLSIVFGAVDGVLRGAEEVDFFFLPAFAFDFVVVEVDLFLSIVILRSIESTCIPCCGFMPLLPSFGIIRLLVESRGVPCEGVVPLGFVRWVGCVPCGAGVVPLPGIGWVVLPGLRCAGVVLVPCGGGVVPLPGFVVLPGFPCDGFILPLSFGMIRWFVVSRIVPRGVVPFGVFRFIESRRIPPFGGIVPPSLGIIRRPVESRRLPGIGDVRPSGGNAVLVRMVSAGLPVLGKVRVFGLVFGGLIVSRKGDVVRLVPGGNVVPGCGLVAFGLVVFGVCAVSDPNAPPRARSNRLYWAFDFKKNFITIGG